jgi:hypothetical protein
MKWLGVGVSADTVCRRKYWPLFVQVSNYHLQYTINCVTMR